MDVLGVSCELFSEKRVLIQERKYWSDELSKLETLKNYLMIAQRKKWMGWNKRELFGFLYVNV